MTGKPKFSGSGFYETDYKQKTNKPVNGGKEKNE